MKQLGNDTQNTSTQRDIAEDENPFITRLMDLLDAILNPVAENTSTATLPLEAVTEAPKPVEPTTNGWVNGLPPPLNLSGVDTHSISKEEQVASLETLAKNLANQAAHQLPVEAAYQPSTHQDDKIITERTFVQAYLTRNPDVQLRIRYNHPTPMVREQALSEIMIKAGLKGVKITNDPEVQAEVRRAYLRYTQ